jgi:TetR/AcrR family transcriptional repressor of nem operon
MGHSREEKAASHARIVGAAARRFRERGIEGIAVAELMAEAGLTHGGFYKHFDSRDALVAEATARAFDDSTRTLAELMPKTGASGLEALLRAYLTEVHRDDAAGGCPVAALVVDASRTAAARPIFEQRYRTYLEWVADMLSGPDEDRRPRAAAIICAMAGAIAVARALGHGELSSAAIEGARRLIGDAEAGREKSKGGAKPHKRVRSKAVKRKNRGECD